MQAILHREVRYRILRALHWNHPTPLSERFAYLSIKNVMPILSESDIASEMSYLRDGKYVLSEMKLDKPRREKVWLHRITKKGIDLLEGSIAADPGIDNPEDL